MTNGTMYDNDDGMLDRADDEDLRAERKMYATAALIGLLASPGRKYESEIAVASAAFNYAEAMMEVDKGRALP